MLPQADGPESDEDERGVDAEEHDHTDPESDFFCDATGQTLRINFVCIVAAQSAIDFIQQSHPDVSVYVGLIEGSVQAPWWNFLLQLTLPGYNALYFCKQAVANYAVHYMLNLLGQDELIKQRIEQRTSVTTGTEILAWKDALGVPQRGS